MCPPTSCRRPAIKKEIIRQTMLISVQNFMAAFVGNVINLKILGSMWASTPTNYDFIELCRWSSTPTDCAFIELHRGSSTPTNCDFIELCRWSSTPTNCDFIELCRWASTPTDCAFIKLHRASSTPTDCALIVSLCSVDFHTYRMVKFPYHTEKILCNFFALQRKITDSFLP